MLDAMPTVPVIVRNNRFDFVAANPLGRALFSEMYGAPPGSPSEDALKLLASWSATAAEVEPAPTGER
jgi:hypothetical protein